MNAVDGLKIFKLQIFQVIDSKIGSDEEKDKFKLEINEIYQDLMIRILEGEERE